MMVEELINSFVKQIGEIFDSFFANYDFMKVIELTEKFNFSVIYRNEERYIEFGCALYPRDYPYYYFISFGEGSNDWPESDWNAVLLARFFDEKKQNEIKGLYGLNFNNITNDFIRERLLKNKELFGKYALDFLSGDLKNFKKIRAEQNKKREPYKISEPDSSGKYYTHYDKKSEELKERFSKV